MDILNTTFRGLVSIYETHAVEDVTVVLTPYQYCECRKRYGSTVAIEMGSTIPEGGIRMFGKEVKVEQRRDNLDAVRLEFQLYNGQPPVIHYVR